MTYWSEAGSQSGAGSSLVPAANKATYYDAAGNVRRTVSNYSNLTAAGGTGTAATADQWYRYDQMNREVLAGGQLVGGEIVRGMAGTDYQYNAAGQRTRSIRSFAGHITILVSGGDILASRAEISDPEPNMAPPGGGYFITIDYTGQRRETYSYDAAGSLKTVRIAQTEAADDGFGEAIITEPTTDGPRKAEFWYDDLGRQTSQVEYLNNGDTNATAAWSRAVTATDSAGRPTTEVVYQRVGSDTFTYLTENQYGAGASYALGAVTWTRTIVLKNDYVYNSGNSNTTTTNTYDWYEGASLKTTNIVTNLTNYTTTYDYSRSGVLASAYIADGVPRTVTYTNDANGKVIARDESGTAPHERWYRFGGQQMGMVGNNGTTETDWKTSASTRQATSGTGAFRNGATAMSSYADFDQGATSYNSYSQGSTGGAYTAQGGENLSMVAANLWGDSSLWYKLAEANGLSGNAALAAGQSLRIPSGVSRSTYNASTFSPYNPADTLGDTMPTRAAPQQANKKKGCGIVGQIIMMAVATAITVLIPPSGIIANAIVGAAASFASQAVGVALGVQDKINLKGVAQSALTAGINSGGFTVDVGIASSMLSGALINAAAQGIGIVTGLQSKFDLASVAVAGVIAGVGHATTGELSRIGIKGNVNQGLSGAASAIAGASARALITGTSFGDNIMATLPDVIGSTIGRMAAGAIAKTSAAALEKRNVEESATANQRQVYEGELRLLKAFGLMPEPDAITLSPGARMLLEALPAPSPRGYVFVGKADPKDQSNLPNSERSNAVENSQIFVAGKSGYHQIDILMSAGKEGSYSLAEVANGLGAFNRKFYSDSGSSFSDHTLDYAKGLFDVAKQRGLPMQDLIAKVEVVSASGQYSEFSAVVSHLSDLEAQYVSDHPFEAAAWSFGRFSNGFLKAAVVAPLNFFGDLTVGTASDLSGQNLGGYSLSNVYAPAVLTFNYGADVLAGRTNIVRDTARTWDNAWDAGARIYDNVVSTYNQGGILAVGSRYSMELGELAGAFVGPKIFTSVRSAGAGSLIAAEGVGGIRTAEGIAYNGLTGPGPLGDAAFTFRSASYTQKVLDTDLVLYRAYGGNAGKLSPYWSRVEPAGPLQARLDSALLPEWNTATQTSIIRVPARTTIYEGAVAPQSTSRLFLPGGGNQVYIPKVNPKWLINK